MVHVTVMARPEVCVLVLLLSLLVASAAETPDFTGSYTLTPAKHASQSVNDVIHTLTVVQTAKSIGVTKTMDGKPYTNTFPLDGAEGICYTQNQTKETCKGHFKGNHLFLESTLITHPLEDGPLVIIHTKERWQLSPDSKTLTIHTDVDAPLLPGVHMEDPWTEIYSRN
jgi:hypothetical protein